MRTWWLPAPLLLLGLLGLARAAPAAPAVEFAPGELLVSWRQPDARPQLNRVAGQRVRRSRRVDASTWLYTLDARDAPSTRRALAALRSDARVAHVEPNYIRRPFRVPNDEMYPLQWHLKAINLEKAWDRTVGSPSVVVAVVDTGIRWAHPDLQGRLLQGFDFIADPAAAGDGNGRDPDARDEGSDSPASSGFHGTHVAGVLGAASNNNAGMAGVDWGCKVLPVRALGINEGSGKDSDIAAAIRWAAGLLVDGTPLNPTPARVINLSFGAPGYGATLARAVQDARAAGAIVVAAAGNFGTDASDIYPAAIPGVITVGATQLGGGLAPYSNFGPTIDIMAPGGNLAQDLGSNFQNKSWGAGILGTMQLTADNSFDYIMLEGTSQATPVVAGVVGLMLSINPKLDDKQALYILSQTANPNGQCAEGCGAGLVNANAALQATAGEIVLSPSSNWPSGGQDGGPITGSGCSLAPASAPAGAVGAGVLAAALLLLCLGQGRRRHR